MFVDSVAPSYSVLALDTAGRLDCELATLATYVDDIRDLIRGDARGALVVNALARVIVIAQLLRAQALHAAVGRDDESIENDERAFLARISIVVRSLFALKQNESWVSRAAWSGRFTSLRDFNVYVVDQLARIHNRWLEQRGPHQSLDAATQRALAYSALDDAEIALERVGRDGAVQRFLRVGSSNACEAVATACRELAATLGVVVTAPCDKTPAQPAERPVDRNAS